MFHHVAAAIPQKSVVNFAAPRAAKFTFGETWPAAAWRETAAAGAWFGFVIPKSFPLTQ